MLFLLFLCYGDYLKIFPMERLHSDGAENLSMLGLAERLSVARLSAGRLPVAVQPGRHRHVFAQRHARRDPSRLRPHGPGQGTCRRLVVIAKHVVRNGLIPIITLFASFLPAMLGGSVLVEYLFNIQGLGLLSFVSIEQKDFPTLMALIYIDAIVVLLSILLSDVLYVVADPRISFASQGASE